MGTEIPDRGPAVRVVTAVVTALSTVVVVLRFITRGLIVRRLGSDDYCLLLGWVCESLSLCDCKKERVPDCSTQFIAIGLSASVILGTSKGLGRYDSDIPSDWEYWLLRWTYIFTVLYVG